MTRVQIERLVAEIESELTHLGQIQAQVEEARSRFDDKEPDSFETQGVALVAYGFTLRWSTLSGLLADFDGAYQSLVADVDEFIAFLRTMAAED